MKKKILALTLSVAMLTTGALTSVPAAEFEDTSVCATEVSSDVIEDFDSLDTREDTEVEFDNTDSNFSSEENIDYSYEGIDSSDSEFISDETEVFAEDVGIDDDINPENSSVSEKQVTSFSVDTSSGASPLSRSAKPFKRNPFLKESATE